MEVHEVKTWCLIEQNWKAFKSLGQPDPSKLLDVTSPLDVGTQKQRWVMLQNFSRTVVSGRNLEWWCLSLKIAFCQRLLSEISWACVFEGFSEPFYLDPETDLAHQEVSHG